MITKILSTILLLFASFGAFASDYMTVELKNGQKYSFLLSEKPVITYENANLVINSNATTSYALENIKNYHFTKIAASIIETSSLALRIISIDEATIEVQNANPLEVVTLTAMSGAKVLTSYVDTDGKVQVKLPNNRGVYVLSVGNKSFKVIRK